MSGRSSNEMSYAPRSAAYLLRQWRYDWIPVEDATFHNRRVGTKTTERPGPAAAITATNVRAGDDILLNEIGAVLLDRALLRGREDLRCDDTAPAARAMKCRPSPAGATVRPVSRIAAILPTRIDGVPEIRVI
jgi:hypothetical protein